jgi:hypothetical protein
MARVQWARGSQFNWVYDNMGGAPLQEAVAGKASGATAVVRADGSIVIEAPNPGGGQVQFVRGVWRLDTRFAWDGFWAAAIDGDLINYYEGGFFINGETATSISLGTPLAPGTEVQLFYIYFTGEQAVKYEALNNYPCVRRAYRSRDDYTYDFAGDRLLDLMVYLHLAEKERGVDYGPARRFLWQALECQNHSLRPPLVYDSFERPLWERGAFLLYRNATRDEAFEVFQTEMLEGSRNRVLHVKINLPAMADSAWFGYGLDWSLKESPFREIDRVCFKLKGRRQSSRLHNLTKNGSGSARLLFAGDYGHRERRFFVVRVETPGEVGTATFRWSQDGGRTWEAEGLVTGDRNHPVPLGGGIEVYWESGDGPDFAAGDYWTFWGGEPEEHPRRLLVCLNDSSSGDPDPWGAVHTYVHALPDRFPELTALELPLNQFWRRDNIIDDGDRVRATWGTWYSASQPDDSLITICDREITEELFGDTFYTQRQIGWDLSPQATAFGVWVGIDPARCPSTGRTALNFLIRPEVAGWSSLTLRVKVKDVNGSYFYRDKQVQVSSWQRVSVNLAEMALESGTWPLTHPIQAVDIGIAASPPSNGVFYLTDIKFDEHLAFTGAQKLRLLEFKIEAQGFPEHEWWLDEVGLNLVAEDPYPYVPRLAISLGPYGQNPWRGPSLVHYAQPLGPYLAGAHALTQTYVNFHRQAQDEYAAHYGGVKGPVLPIHTRNDIENVALCGEENFGKFCWWSRYRNYGKVSGVWHFNEALTDASGNGHTLWWSGDCPAYGEGVCQPGHTTLELDGSGHASLASNPLFEPGTDPFSLVLIIKGLPQATGYCWLMDKMGGDGWVIQTKEAGNQDLQLKVTTTAGDSYSDIPEGLDGAWHLLIWMVVPAEGRIYKIKDGVFLGYDSLAVGNGLNNRAYLNIGSGGVFSLDYFRYERRVLPAAEYESAWDIARGLQNGSAYPEAGHGLAQYWAFYRLAQYYFVTGDPGAGEILAHWLTWLDAYGAPDGTGWKLPLCFSEFGFQYGQYDPGAAASVALGCLFIYLRNGDQTAALWARRLLDDLRLNRQSSEFGRGYKSDYHYAWLNALVAQAFGVAAHGLAGQAYRFPGTPEDKAHFDALLAWMLAHSGDAKPNLLNADLLPFTHMEDVDIWDYAPHYVFSREMGSLEALVLMAGAALHYAKACGDWSWFDRLVRFVLTDRLVLLDSAQIRSLTTSHHLAEGKNVVRLYFADYDRDNSKYYEARDEAAVSRWGEVAADLDFRYGGPVILENPEVARVLAERFLKRLAVPWDCLQAETWLEGARVELGDVVAVSSDFHGLEREEFTVFGKTLDLRRRRVHLDAARPAPWTWAWAVDAATGAQEAGAIDQDSSYDENWEYRAYAL